MHTASHRLSRTSRAALIVIALLLASMLAACGDEDKGYTLDDHSPDSRLDWGDHPPEVALRSTENQRFRFDDRVGEQPVLVMFYQGIACESCLQLITDLGNDADFQALDVALWGIAPDSRLEQVNARVAHNIQTPMLVDERLHAAEAFDVLQWGADGKPGLTFVLIDRYGHISWVQDYGAVEHGGQFTVPVAAITGAVAEHLKRQFH